ncbi:MAG: aminotransferase class V-fold PLP-dependent enzyme, partial [SAR324 cluster bacterium]|nr:aminotransferase class V-fold PLP-dependent enzyme [SAR324 cluster bacterium]
GCQAVPHLAVDLQKLDCDFYAFSGHKMLGPTGIGVLWGKHQILEQLPPFLYGGDMISAVTIESTSFNVIPRRFEAGTPNVSGGIGLGAATEYLSKIGMDEIRSHEKKLLSYAMERMSELKGVTLYGCPDVDRRSGVFSFNVDNVHPHDVAQVLDDRGIAVRSGDHCGQPFMKELGIRGAVRASFYLYNTTDEIDALIQGLLRVKEIFA